MERHAHLVVVPVRILALATVVAKVVPGGKSALHGNFKHQQFDPVAGKASPPDLILVLTASLTAKRTEGLRFTRHEALFSAAYKAFVTNA
jgi:hypothetical protein